MNESEFRQLWGIEKPIYLAWGKYVNKVIKDSLLQDGKNAKAFFKVEPECRLKEDGSLLDKAFNRGKTYANPYEEIEDKVGVRYVVLLLDEINYVSEKIESCGDWIFDPCKHFDQDKKNSPLLFTYQSVHYVLRSKSDIEFDGVVVPANTPCEVQIRTLLQHAHAELTHDAIYKAKKAIAPDVHRIVAKSMALIETTDEFFSEVTKRINFGPLQEYNVVERLDHLYRSRVGFNACVHKSSIVVWDTYEDLIDSDLVDNVEKVFNKYTNLGDVIRARCGENTFYQQSSVIFVFWMLWRKRRRLLADWPLSDNILESMANDVSVSLDFE